MSSFRTIEVSDPDLEPEDLRFVTVKSDHLNGRGNVTLFVPRRAEEPVPLLLLLHGVYGSHWSWAFKGAAHRTTRSLVESNRIRPIAIAMPSDGLWGDGSGYLQHASRDFSSWITNDSLNVAREVVDAVTPASPLLLGGLSMGGFGALRIGCRNGDLFRAVSAHSSITRLAEMEQFVEESLDHYRHELTHESVFDTIRSNREQLPELRFDCGRSDDLLEGNRELHRNLEEEGIPHNYREFSGGHNWSYWREHLRDSLLFFEETFQEGTDS